MIVTHKIYMDLARHGDMPCVVVTQGDKYSRELEIHLRMNGEAFELPEGCRVMVSYSKTFARKRAYDPIPDEVSGAYDTMPDGSEAWRVSGDTVTVGLAPQLCTAAGKVLLTVTLMHGSSELGCFTICLEVQEKSGAKGPREAYVNINGFIPQPNEARAGQYLEIQEVDAFGRVAQLKTVDPPKSAAPDWSAAEGEAGHVRNRTHWVETVEVDPTFDGDLTGRETVFVQSGTYAVKVSPEYVDTTALTGASVVFDAGGTELTQTIAAGMAIDAVAVLGVSGSVVLMGTDPVVLSLPEDTEIQGAYFSAGTWFMCMEGQFYVKSLSCLASGKQEFIHKLPKKFLPDNLGGGGIFTVTVTDDGSGKCTADKTVAEMSEAYLNGMVMQCKYLETGNIYGTLLHLQSAVPEVGAFAFTGQKYPNLLDTLSVAFMEGSIFKFSAEAPKAPSIPSKLPNPNYVSFRNARASTTTNAASAYSVGNFNYDGSKVLYIKGLPNPYALTVGNTTYDGSAAVDLTEAINAMIDAKMNTAANAEEVAF